MKGGQIQASGLDHPAGWPRIHTAVVTKGCVLVVCSCVLVFAPNVYRHDIDVFNIKMNSLHGINFFRGKNVFLHTTPYQNKDIGRPISRQWRHLHA